jgi:hypothetical protein
MTYDVARQRVVLFGGLKDGATVLGDTWEWNGTTWADVTPSTPSPLGRHDHTLVYNANRHASVLVAGTTNGARVNDTWEWNGTRWTNIAIAVRPTDRQAHTAAYDPIRSQLLVFGGNPLNPVQETWLLRYDGGESGESCYTGIDGDGDDKIGCADPDCYGVCAPLCNPRVATCAVSPRCGDGTCQSVETQRLCPADCIGASIVACGDFICESPETLASCPGDCTP